MRLISKVYIPAKLSHAVYIAALALCALLLCYHPIANLDIWTDLTLGSWIWNNAALPVDDPILYTPTAVFSANGWLSRVIFYLLWKAGAFPLISICKVAVILAAFTFIFLTVRVMSDRVNRWAYPVALLGMVVASMRFQARTEMFGMLCFAIAIYVIARSRMRETIPWLLIPLQLTWANLHASFLLGPLLMICWICGDLIEKYVLAQSTDERRPGTLVLALILAAMIAVSAIHPGGLAYLLHPLRQQSDWLFGHHIMEWIPPFAYNGNLAFKLLSAVFATATVLCTAVTRSGYLMLSSAVLIFMFLTSGRHIGYLALFGIPTIYAGLSAMLSTSKSDRRWANAGKFLPAFAMLAGFILVFTGFAERSFGILDGRRLGVDESHQPRAAANFLLDNDIEGNVFNNYDVGGYLSWRLAGKRTIFIDGRNLVYGPELYRRYLEAVKFPETYWNEFVRENDITVVLLGTHSQDCTALIAYLSKQDGWPTVLADDDAILFIRRDSGNDEIIANRAFDIDAESMLAHYVSRHGSSPDAWTFCDLGNTAFLAGTMDAAAILYERAISMNPDSCPRSYELSIIYRMRGDDANYARCIARSVVEHPGDARIHYELGLLAENDDNVNGAIKHYRRAVHLLPDFSSALNNLGRIFIERRQFDKAGDYLKRAVASDPNNAGAIRNLGLYHRYASHNFREAIRLWEQYLTLVPDSKDAALMRKEMKRMKELL